MTGGPCGGKSTAIPLLRDSITAKYGATTDVYTIPEVPTILLLGGCRYPSTAPGREKELLEFECGILSLQLAMEKSFLSIARSVPGRNAVCLLDRASFDLVSYMTPELWVQTMAHAGETEESLRARYDAVVFLESAACGAEESYRFNDNNKARTEGLEEARQLDRRTRDSYSLRFSPAFHLIENRRVDSPFQDKLNRIEACVLDIVSRHFAR